MNRNNPTSRQQARSYVLQPASQASSCSARAHRRRRPLASLQAARQAIPRRGAGRKPSRHASGELGEARNQVYADTAVSEQRMTMAERLAVESRVEAELASAKTADVKAKAVNDEMTRGTGTLIEEMQRNSGEKQ